MSNSSPAGRIRSVVDTRSDLIINSDSSARSTVGQLREPGSEAHANAAVDHASIEWRPGIHRPAAVGRPRGSEERTPIGLPDVGEILRIDEQAQLAHAPFHQSAEQQVRRALAPVRIVFETLPAGQIALDADAAPGPAF